MKFRVLFLLFLVWLISACTTPSVFSTVTTFHEWPADLRDKSYVFMRDKAQDNSLEYQSYENLVRTELARWGFTEAKNSAPAALKASLAWSSTPHDVTVSEPVMLNSPDPYWPRPYWRSFYGPYYDPFWPPPPVIGQRDRTVRMYTQQFRIVLTLSATGKTVQETTVVSEEESPSLAAVMPYMIHSAFMDFPGPSGLPRKIELKKEKEKKQDRAARQE